MFRMLYIHGNINMLLNENYDDVEEEEAETEERFLFA